MPEKEISAMQKSPVWEDRVKIVPTIPRELSLNETYHFDGKNLSGVQVPTITTFMSNKNSKNSRVSLRRDCL